MGVKTLLLSHNVETLGQMELQRRPWRDWQEVTCQGKSTRVGGGHGPCNGFSLVIQFRCSQPQGSCSATNPRLKLIAFCTRAAIRE